MKQKNKNSDDQYQIYLNLGIKKAKIGNFEQSKNIFLKAIKINNIKSEAYINLSNVYIFLNQIDKSINLLTKYISKIKFDEKVSLHLGNICKRYNKTNEMLKLFKVSKLEQLNFSSEKKHLYFLQGQYYEKNYNFHKAILSYKNSILCNDEYFDAYIGLYNLLESTNDIKSFEKYIHLGLKNFKNKEEITTIYFYKSLLLNRQGRFDESQKLINEKKLSLRFQNKEKFLLRLIDLESKNYEKLKNYSMAFEKVKTRNIKVKKLKENSKFSKLTILQTIEKYKKFYTKKNIEHINSKLNYDDDKNLVFLIGFPRSGTTLLDTILRTHSKINVLEEKPILLELRHEFFKERNNNLESLLKITQKEKDKIRKNYLDKIDVNLNDKNKLIIDKLPLSIIELGFIKSIFPNSKIVLAMRHPCDVTISCFFSSFKINDAMVNFLDWNDTVSFYNEVLTLFEFYEHELNLKYFEIKYENVVNDFQKQIGLLLNFLDLKYESQLEQFHITAKNRTKISTPSYSQVINPLYKSSIERWRNYNALVNPESDLKKWIKKFNY